MHNLSKYLYKYLRCCPECQVNQTPRHKPYGDMQPILTSSKPFQAITIDFILALPRSTSGNDCILSVTDKFSKAMAFIPGQTTWKATDWAQQLLDRLSLMNWGLPRVIIHDRDRKFVSELWRAIFKALKVDLLFSTAYHPQTDGSSERTNQTAEIALRYQLITLKDVCY